MSGLNIIIAGGGIGGLTAAIALHRDGHRIQVVEKAPAMGWGQGVQISPPAMDILAGLGVADAVMQAGQIMRSTCKLTSDGLVLRERALGRVSGVDQAHVAISRGTLQLVLAEEVKRLGVEVLLDHAVEDITEGEDSVLCDLAPVSAENAPPRQLESDLLLGADGIHSATRKTLFPDDLPVYTGYVQYRGVLPVDGFEDQVEPGRVVVYGNPRNFYSCYLMNEKEISFGACVHVGQHQEPSKSWATRGDADELVAQFEDFAGPLPQLASRIPYLARMHIFDHARLPHWGTGRVTLLGDAAHAMLPFAGQATVTAIEDAMTLARLLGGHASSLDAIAEYQAERIPHVARIRDHCRDRGGVFEEYLVAETLQGHDWEQLPADQRQARLDAIDWARHDSFLRALY